MGPPSGDWGEESGPKGLSVRPEDPDNAYYVSVTKSGGAHSENVNPLHPVQACDAASRPRGRTK